MTALDLMTADPAFCSPRDLVTVAASLMAEHDCGGIPVLDPDTGRIAGMLTDRDLALRVIGLGRDPRTVLVREVMSRGVVCCAPEADPYRIGQFMRFHRVRRIPVVDEAGRVIGIVSLADLVSRGRMGPNPLEIDELVHTLDILSDAQAHRRPIALVSD